jgi:hypothetical protein
MAWFQSQHVRPSLFLALVLLIIGLIVPNFLQGQDALALFNGRDLAGWKEVGGTEVFTVREGDVVAAPPGPAESWLRSDEEFENFDLSLEFRTPGWSESGILLFAPLHGRPSQVGLKLHLRHDNLEEGARSVGAIYDVLPPLKRVVREQGEWNRLEVLSDWPVLRVKLNGEVIHDLNRDLLPELRWRSRRGYLGLQFLGSPIRFRNLNIRRLPDREDGWISLHNGVDLEGWTVRGQAPWRVQDGGIVSDGGDGYLISRDSFSAFLFQVMVRTSPQANGGVFFRWGGENGRGYEAQIYNVADATNPTGSIYGFAFARDLRSSDGEWFHLQIISDGGSALVFVNGEKVAESHALTIPDQGNLALQMHSPGRIEFLNPRVRPLRDTPEGLR